MMLVKRQGFKLRQQVNTCGDENNENRIRRAAALKQG